MLGQVINRMEQKLEQQKKLKELMVIFKQEKELFSQGEVTKHQAWKMVHAARAVLDIIAEQHLQYLFSSAYMEELTMFSSIAGKNKPARP